MKNKITLLVLLLVCAVALSVPVVRASSDSMREAIISGSIDRIVEIIMNGEAFSLGARSDADTEPTYLDDGEWTYIGDVYADDMEVIDDLYVRDDVTVTDDLTVSGETDLEGLTYGNGTLASTTTGTAGGTLTEANLLANYILDVKSNVDVTFPLTLPATSTMTTLLPTAGDTREWMIYNASTTAGVAMTITAGAGIDLIGVTTNDDVIDGDEWSSLKCYRRATTDVVCIISELLHVD